MSPFAAEITESVRPSVGQYDVIDFVTAKKKRQTTNKHSYGEREMVVVIIRKQDVFAGECGSRVRAIDKQNNAADSGYVWHLEVREERRETHVTDHVVGVFKH